MPLFQSNLRKQIRNLPKILNFVKKFTIISELFTSLLRRQSPGRRGATTLKSAEIPHHHCKRNMFLSKSLFFPCSACLFANVIFCLRHVLPFFLPFPFHKLWRRTPPVPSVFEDRSGIHATPFRERQRGIPSILSSENEPSKVCQELNS